MAFPDQERMMIPRAIPIIMIRYMRISVVANLLYFVQKESLLSAILVFC